MPVAVDFLFGEIQLELWEALLCAFGAGFALAGAGWLWSGLRSRMTVRRYRKAVGGLEAEIHQLRNLPLATGGEPSDPRAGGAARAVRGAADRDVRLAAPAQIGRRARDAEAAARAALLAVLDRDHERAEQLLVASARARLERRRAVPRARALLPDARRDRPRDPAAPEPAAAPRPRPRPADRVPRRPRRRLPRRAASCSARSRRTRRCSSAIRSTCRALRALVALLGDARDHPRAIEMQRRLARIEQRDGAAENAELWVDMAEAAQAEGRTRDARRAVQARAARRPALACARGSLLGAARGRARPLEGRARGLAAGAGDRPQERRARVSADRVGLRGARPRARVRGLSARAARRARRRSRTRASRSRARSRRAARSRRRSPSCAACSSAIRSTSPRARRSGACCSPSTAIPRPPRSTPSCSTCSSAAACCARGSGWNERRARGARREVGARHADDAPVPRDQGGASGRDRVLPDGRLLRDVPARRRDRRAAARHRAHHARQEQARRGADVRRARARRRPVPRRARRARPPRGDLRAGRGRARGVGPPARAARGGRGGDARRSRAIPHAIDAGRRARARGARGRDRRSGSRCSTPRPATCARPRSTRPARAACRPRCSRSCARVAPRELLLPDDARARRRARARAARAPRASALAAECFDAARAPRHPDGLRAGRAGPGLARGRRAARTTSAATSRSRSRRSRGCGAMRSPTRWCSTRRRARTSSCSATREDGSRARTLIARIDETRDAARRAAARALARLSARRSRGDRSRARPRWRASPSATACARALREALRAGARPRAAAREGRATGRHAARPRRAARVARGAAGGRGGARAARSRDEDLLGEARPAALPVPRAGAARGGALREALDDEVRPLPRGSRGALETGYIRAGFHAELDGLREAVHKGREWIAGLEAEERARTGIATLKIRFHPVHGYGIEVTKANLERVPGRLRAPPDARQRGALRDAASCARSSSQVRGGTERAAALEREIFERLRLAALEAAARDRARRGGGGRARRARVARRGGAARRLDAPARGRGAAARDPRGPPPGGRAAAGRAAAARRSCPTTPSSTPPRARCSC